MLETDVLPELKQIIGALLFAAKGTVSVADIRRCLKQVAEDRGGVYRDFAELSDKDVADALELFRRDLDAARLGVNVAEVANGFRMENDVACGPWLREFLQKGRASRLSRPALETLAVIAYRQPCSRAEIEAVRGVAVDQILRNLIDLQLIKIVGRSELPGRPWLFGTTQKFLEYFGLNNVKELPGVEELRRIEEEQAAAKAKAPVSEEEPTAESTPEGAAAEPSEESASEADEPADTQGLNELDDGDEFEDEEGDDDSEDGDEDEDEYSDDEYDDDDDDGDEDGDEFEDEEGEDEDDPDDEKDS